MSLYLVQAPKGSLMNAICIIPARGGSKRIQRKNIATFHGRPMIGWSIDAARECGLFERIIVSTDDEEISEVASSEGAEVPFVRPSSIAGDFTPTIPVIEHAIKTLGLDGKVAICCLYATAPLVRPDDLLRGYKMLEEASFVVAITSFPFPIQRALLLQDNGLVNLLQPDHALTRSQDLPETWHDAGQFYWGYASAWETNSSIFISGAKGVPLPRYRVQDIDTPEDWERAELIFAALKDRK